VALVALVEQLQVSGMTLLDVQWVTPHLATLGAVEVPRAAYLSMLTDALAVPATFRTQFAHG
jgi:leucyl/phenylalanyl-tRNA--protein transferase